MKIFIVIPDNDITATFLTPRARKQLEALGEVTQNPYDRAMTPEEIVEHAKDAEILLTGWQTPYMEKEHIAQMKNLKLIAHTGGTVATILAPEVYELGVKVISGNDVFAKSVAEGTLCYTLCALRRMEHYISVMRESGWKEAVPVNRGLFAKKVGIVGYGTIAKHFVNMIRYFGCDILIHSSHLTDEEAAKVGGRTASLEEIFSDCDIVSLHLAKTPKTDGMITRELLEMLKPNALLVNTSRGSVVDEEALIDLLSQNRFSAALDVVQHEPCVPDHPLRFMKNVLIMPHMAGPTIDMREVVALELCKDIIRLQKGEELQYTIDKAAAMRMTR